jgi:hypothetical protein
MSGYDAMRIDLGQLPAKWLEPVDHAGPSNVINVAS